MLRILAPRATRRSPSGSMFAAYETPPRNQRQIRQLPIAPQPRRLLHCPYTSFQRTTPSFPRRREPRIPAALCGCQVPSPLRGEGEDEGDRGEYREAMPRAGGGGGVPHKPTGRVGGKNYVRQAQLRKGLLWEKARMRVQGTGNATKCNEMQLNLKFAAPAHAPSFPCRRELRIHGPITTVYERNDRK